MTPDSKVAAKADDPLADAKTRKLAAETALSKAKQASTMANGAVTSTAATETQLAKQRKQVEVLHENARRSHQEAVKRAEALEAVRAFAEIDVVIAGLEHELRTADLVAAGATPRGPEEAAAAAARVRLEREKELREYDAHKRKAEKAQAVLDQIEDAERRNVRQAVLDKAKADLALQLKKKEQDRERLAESVKKATDELTGLSQKLKELEKAREALSPPNGR